MSHELTCPRTECGSILDDGVCNACGHGAKLAAIPDFEAGRLFDEWWASVPKQLMEMYAQQGSVQERFDAWRAERSTKH